MGGAFSRANANFNPNVNPNKPDVAPFTTCQDLIPVLEKGMGVFENNANCDRAVRLAATQVNAVTSDPPRPECSQPTSFTFINNFGSGQIYLNNTPSQPPENPPKSGGPPFASISSGFCSGDSLLNFDLISILGVDIMQRAVIIILSQFVIWSFYNVLNEYFKSLDYNFTDSNYLSHNSLLEEQILKNLQQLDS